MCAIDNLLHHLFQRPCNSGATSVTKSKRPEVEIGGVTMSVLTVLGVLFRFDFSSSGPLRLV